MGSKSRVIVAVIVVIAVVVAIIWYVMRPTSETQPGQAPVPPPASQPAETPAPPVVPQQPPQPQPVAPPQTLQNSDATVKLAAEDVSPKLAEWLAPNQELRKLVLTVANLADGKVVAKQRPLLYSTPAFKVEKRGGKLYMSEANYQRLTPVVDALVSIPPEKLAAYLHGWQTILDQAYAELGKAGSFHDELTNAIKQVLGAKPLDNPPEVKMFHSYYVYADSRLQKASSVDRLMWRLGPDNMQRIQQYLRELQSDLKSPAPAPAQETSD